MATFTYKDLRISYMLIALALSRGAYQPDEIAGAQDCLLALEKFSNDLKNQITADQSIFIEDIEFGNDQ